jgi:flagellar capping protein FliD
MDATVSSGGLAGGDRTTTFDTETRKTNKRRETFLKRYAHNGSLTENAVAEGKKMMKAYKQAGKEGYVEGGLAGGDRTTTYDTEARKTNKRRETFLRRYEHKDTLAENAVAEGKKMLKAYKQAGKEGYVEPRVRSTSPKKRSRSRSASRKLKGGKKMARK